MKSPYFNGYSSRIPKSLVKYFTFLVFVLFSFSMFPQQLAFPAAKGAGAFVTGGRGHSVYHVTNLNNSGTGSFRDATSSSNRIIVFDVSGTIELTSNLYIDSDNLTIAGQSAPLGGITITGAAVHFQNVDNVIVRYLRFRPDYNSSGSVDALNAYNCTNFIVDHCSISWGGDEAFSITGASSNVTVQNCISGESATGMLVGHSSSSETSNFSIIGNLWYNISHRFPNVHVLRTDLINNVVHNWYTRLKEINASHTVDLNEINNYYQSGNKTGAPLSPNWSITWLESGKTFRIYTDGNVRTEYVTESDDDWDLYVDRVTWNPSNPDFQQSTPFPLLGEAPTITTAAEALINVPLNAGANKYLNSDGSVGEYRDDVDALYITNVANGISEGYSYPPTDIVNKQSYIDFHNSVSSTPINVRPSDYDTNNDGMPDDWKISKGFGVNDDLDTYEWPSGYIGVEEFLNEIDGGTNNNNNSQVNAGPDLSICEGEQVTLTASGSVSYLWSNTETSASITVSPTETTMYTVTGTDSEGNETTDSVTVTVNPLPTANAGGDLDICEDSSVGLSASGGDSYLWSTGETTQNISVSPQVNTTYTVTVTSNGCSDTDEVTVTVHPRPTINAGNDVDIYLGESATLTAVGEGVFEWSTGETTESITVTPTISETYTVTATLNGCTNTDSVLVTILDNEETVLADAGEDTTICEGETVTLTASGGDNYLWSTGETTQSIEVSPNDTTTYSVTVSNNTNSDTDDVIVNVNPTPVADAGEDQTILHGQAITLSATGGSEYIWSTGETTQQITVHPTENTDFTVEVLQGGCSDFDTVAVIVNVVANIDDDTTICQGSSTTLSASGGSNYIWSNGETTQSIEVSPSQTTTYTVIVSNGTSSDAASVTVNVNLLPNANAGEDVTIEEGQNVTLSASGGNTYVWNTGDTSQNISVSPTETTTYTVETIINGCSNYDEVTVTVVPPVDADAGEDVEICYGDEITLTASGGEFFEWSTGDTTASINVAPHQTTMYSVSVSNGVSEEFAEVVVILDNCLDSDSEEDQVFGFDYTMYPNPSNGEVNIKLSGLENISSLYITDILGKTILTETISTNNGSVINKSYNLSSVTKGIYFVTFIQSGKDAITKKLILN